MINSLTSSFQQDEHYWIENWRGRKIDVTEKQVDNNISASSFSDASKKGDAINGFITSLQQLNERGGSGRGGQRFVIF